MSLKPRISRLTLGTAQIGFKYGISNKEGKIPTNKAKEILRTAITNGITCFDTAPSYGESERILGEFFSSNDQFQLPIIVTKLPQVIIQDKFKEKLVYNNVKKQLLSSTQKLRLNKIPVYLIHHPSNITDYKGQIIDALVRLREEQLVGRIGASIYTPDEAQSVLDNGKLTAIQLPFNIFDLRFITSGLLEELEKQRFVIFARSIFLQGLFFLNPEKLPKGLKTAQKPLNRLNEIALSENYSIAELALLFVKEQTEITSVVIGAETQDQILENIKIFTSPNSLSLNLKSEIMSTFVDLPENLIEPRLWKLTL
ncbi:MAG: aldo/keto reductase [Promethearchaeota archaeon]